MAPFSTANPAAASAIEMSTSAMIRCWGTDSTTRFQHKLTLAGGFRAIGSITGEVPTKPATGAG